MERERFRNPDTEWPEPRPEPADELAEPWAQPVTWPCDTEGGEQ